MKTRNSVDPLDPPADREILSRDNREIASDDGGRRQPNGARTVAKRGKSQTSAAVTVLAAILKPGSHATVESGGAEHIEYKGYILRVDRQRNGWNVAIFPKGSPFALIRNPYTAELGERDAVIARAMAIVDRETADGAAQTVAAPAEGVKRTRPRRGAFLVRLWRALARAWAAVKRFYFSIDQTPRAS